MKLCGGPLTPLRELCSRIHVCFYDRMLPQMTSHLCFLILSSLGVSSQLGQSISLLLLSWTLNVFWPWTSMIRNIWTGMHAQDRSAKYLSELTFCCRFGGCFLRPTGSDSQRGRGSFLPVCVRWQFTACQRHLAQRWPTSQAWPTDSGEQHCSSNVAHILIWLFLQYISLYACFHGQGAYGGGNQKKTSGTLHLFNTTLEDGGLYTCVTHNPLLNISKRSNPAKLTVQGEIMFSTLRFCSGFSYHSSSESIQRKK